MKSYSMHDVCEKAHICPMTDMCFFNAVFREIFPKNLTIDIIREIDDAYVKDFFPFFSNIHRCLFSTAYHSPKRASRPAEVNM